MEFGHLSWIFSGIGCVALMSLRAWARRVRRGSTRSLVSVVEQVSNSSLAIVFPEAITAIVGMMVRFKGRVAEASADAGGESVTVEFEIRRKARVRCTFERERFPEITLLKVGQKYAVEGKIISATRELIVVRPSPSTS